jgi:hypothetical protein
LIVLTRAAAGAVPEASLRQTDGTPVSLATLRGRPAILFYEDRGSHAWNAGLKEALFARGRARGLLDRVQVIAVANVAAFDFFPAREIALGFIRRLEAQAGIRILIDLDGTLARPPWSLPAEGAAVVVLDARGNPVLERHGRLPPADVETVLATLERLATEHAQ